jgi:phosphomannomutase
MTVDADLRTAVEAWLDDDPDERDRAELRALLNSGDGAELADRFAGRLTFGTAGLRGAIGAGPNRMNRAVVRAATAAVAGCCSTAAARGTSWSGVTRGTAATSSLTR